MKSPTVRVPRRMLLAVFAVLFRYSRGYPVSRELSRSALTWLERVIGALLVALPLLCSAADSPVIDQVIRSLRWSEKPYLIHANYYGRPKYGFVATASPEYIRLFHDPDHKETLKRRGYTIRKADENGSWQAVNYIPQ